MAKRKSKSNDQGKDLIVEGNITPKGLMLRMSWGSPMPKDKAALMGDMIAKFAASMYGIYSGNGVKLVDSKTQMFSRIKGKQ